MRLKVIESKYRKSELILDIYSEFGNIGIWYCDKVTGYEEISEAWANMLGYDAKELNPMTDDKFLALMHPDDLEASLEKANALYNGHTLKYENEFRLKHRNGDYIWVLSQAKIYAWHHGKPKLIIGTHINIDKQKKMIEKMRKHTHSVVLAFSKAIEIKDEYTKHHLENVAKIAVLIGQNMQLNDEQLEQLWMAAHLHDLGKVQIPIEILNKTGPLTQEEYDIVKLHSVHAYEILKEFDYGFPLAEIVKQHHERLDGSGYPDGLKGDAINIFSQIIAIADTIDAMLTDRPYRNRCSLKEVKATLTELKGVHYDDDLVAYAMMFLDSRDFFYG